MNDATPEIHRLARRLIELKAQGEQGDEAGIGIPLRAVEALRLPLTTLSGAEGFRSLLSRALALARPGAPALAFLRVHADGSLDGAHTIPPEMADDAAAAGAALMAELIALLISFIGEPLTFQVLRLEWPEAALEYKSMEKEIPR
jgi:hypothetical protein